MNYETFYVNTTTGPQIYRTSSAAVKMRPKKEVLVSGDPSVFFGHACLNPVFTHYKYKTHVELIVMDLYTLLQARIRITVAIALVRPLILQPRIT